MKLGFGICGLLLYSVWALSIGYLQLAKHYAERDLAAAQRVIELSIKKLPWQKTESRHLLAEWRLPQSPAAAAAAMRQALSSNPADPYLWSRYAIMLLFAGEYLDAEIAIQQTAKLAPKTVPILIEQSLIGGQFLPFVSPRTANYWRDAAERLYGNDPNLITRTVIAAQRVQSFCRLPNSQSPMQTWCELAQKRRLSCAKVNRKQIKLARNCDRLGYITQ